MPTDATLEAARSAAPRAAEEPGSISRTSPAAIVVGALIAAALMLLLDFLGLGVGLFAVEPGETGRPFANFGVGAVIYLIVAAVASMIVGGYAAGRLSGALTAETAGLHGAGVWAIATFIVVIGVGWLGGTVASGAVGALGSTLQAAQQAGAAVLPGDFEPPEVSLPEVALADLPPEIRRALRRRDLTVEEIRQEARAVATEIVSRQERRRIAEAATEAVAGAIRTPTQAASEFEAAIDEIVGRGGALSEEDVEDAAQTLAARLGVPPQEAERILADWAERIRAAWNEAEQAVAEAREAAVEAADATADAAAAAALWTFVVSAAGLAGAIGGAAGGRPEAPTRIGARRA